MQTIEYYFKIEFQYKNGIWLSNLGNLRVSVNATQEILKLRYVNYNILGDFIVLTPSMHQISKAELLINRIKQELTDKGETYYGNENIGLEIKYDFSRPIDHLTPVEKRGEQSINWNIITPLELQYIPTQEIFKLFDDWLDFLKEVELNSPKFRD